MPWSPVSGFNGDDEPTRHDPRCLEDDMGFYKVSFFHEPPTDGSPANLTYALSQALHTQNCLDLSIILKTATSPVFSLTVVGRRVLPLEGGGGESMISCAPCLICQIIVGCRLTVGPTTCSVSTFAGKKRGFRSEILIQRKWSKGRKIILQIGLFLLVWKVEPCIYAVKFASLPIVLRECGARHRRIRWGGYNPWHIFVIIHTNK